MKSPCNSLDVFEFRVDEEMLAESEAKRFYDHAEMLPEEFEDAPTMGIDAAGVDHNPKAASSFISFDKEHCVYGKNPGLDDNQCAGSKSREQIAQTATDRGENSDVVHGIECSSVSEATGHGNVSFSKSAYNDESVDTSVDADGTTSEQSFSSASPDNDASSDGPSSGNGFMGWNMCDGQTEIVFCPDYVEYHDVQYLDTVVIFSRSSIEAKGKAVQGDQVNFHIQLEIEDIIRIVSQWSLQYDTGFLNIQFIPKDAVQKEDDYGSSEIQEFKFAAVDSYWHEKQEAIESMDSRYRACWTVLDPRTSAELCEGKNVMLPRHYFPKFNKHFEDVYYPEGDSDAVSLSKRDIDLLQPDTFVNDTIIDFYIKYLKNKQTPEDRLRFHFFNSFFFRKLADMDKDPSSAFDGKAAFQRVRKWTRKVNLLEKDFIFIPLNYNYHWSLIVICYLSEIANYEDKSIRVPCILHMDSLKGTHGGLKDLMQSYLWEEWKERHKEQSEDLELKFRNLKFVPLELPQQQNSYDCGLFLLHYVECFLEEVPQDFSIHKIMSSSNFLQADWFPPNEASIKRAHIERLIYDLIDSNAERSLPMDPGTKQCTPNSCAAINGYEDTAQLPSGSSDARMGCHESSVSSQISQGIEMTLIPKASVEPARDTGLVLRELLDPGSASGSLDTPQCQASKHEVSLNDFSGPSPPLEERMDANQHCLYAAPAEFNFQHVDAMTTKSYVHYSLSRLDSIYQIALEDIDSSPVTSNRNSDDAPEVDIDKKCQSVGEIGLDNTKVEKTGCASAENSGCFKDRLSSTAEEPHTADDFGSLLQTSNNTDGVFSLGNLPKSYHQPSDFTSGRGNPHEISLGGPASVSVDVLNILEHQNPIKMLDSNDHADTIAQSVTYSPGPHGNDMLADGGTCDVLISLSAEQHPAKRIRLTLPSDEEHLTNNVPKDIF